MANSRAVSYGIYEKKNPLALHGIFDSLERAEYHLREMIPKYCRRGYFMDKTLSPDDFEVRVLRRHQNSKKVR